jgi:hypothetical protein
VARCLLDWGSPAVFPGGLKPPMRIEVPPVRQGEGGAAASGGRNAANGK